MAGTALSLYGTWISYRTGRMCKCSLFLVLFQRLVTSVVGLSYLVGIYTYVHVGHILSSVDHVQHNQAVQFGDLVGSI